MNDNPTEEPRLTWGAIIAVLDALEAAGFRKADDAHTGRAIGLLAQVARVYAGELDEAAGAGDPSVPGGWRLLVEKQALRDAVRWCEGQAGSWPAGQIGMYRALAAELGIEL